MCGPKRLEWAAQLQQTSEAAGLPSLCLLNACSSMDCVHQRTSWPWSSLLSLCRYREIGCKIW